GVRDFAQRQRLEELHARFEELALPIHDEVHHLQHRVPPLLDGLDQPLRGVELVRDEFLVLALELLLVARDVLIDAAQLQSRQVAVVHEPQVRPVDLLDHHVRDHVVVLLARLRESRLRAQFRDVVRRALHLDRRHADLSCHVTPAVRDQFLEEIAREALGERAGLPGILQLQQQALAKVARSGPGRVEPLDDRQHFLRLGHRIERQLLVVAPGALGRFRHDVVDALEDLAQRRREVAVVVDVSDELFGEQQLARVEVEQLDLFEQVVVEMMRADRYRLVLLPIVALLAHAARRLEPVEQDLLPVCLGVRVRVGFLHRDFGRRLQLRFRLLVGPRLFLVVLEHVEERIRKQFLLQVLLQVEQRHVQHVHRLIEARIDLELLPKAKALAEPSLHPAASGGDSVGCTTCAGAGGRSPCSALKRVRSRAVSVGPREISATVSSNTSSRTRPETFTWPSNRMYARSTMSRVCSTLWSEMSTPMPRCLRLATICWMSCTAMGSTPANGSSSIMNFGCVTRPLVISSRRRSPPESENALFARRCLMLSSSRRPSSRSSRSFRPIGSVSRMARMFSSTVSLRNTDGSCER